MGLTDLKPHASFLWQMSMLREHAQTKEDSATFSEHQPTNRQPSNRQQSLAKPAGCRASRSEHLSLEKGALQPAGREKAEDQMLGGWHQAVPSRPAYHQCH